MYAETNLATAKAWISYNKLNLLLTDKDTTIEVRLLNALKTSQFWEYKYKHEKEVVKEKYVPKFTKIMSKTGIILTLLLIAYIAFKMRNKGILNIFKK
jgi:L-lactate permease